MTGLSEDFWWGTGASSTQSEGAAPASDWARWEELGRAPRSGSGNGFGTNYRDDFALLASFGFTHHRLSIEWARIEPREGHRDGGAIEHYREMLTAARDAGLRVWVCLHHFTLPGWFSDDAGGFLDDRARTYWWPRHVDFVAETFGDLVFGWKPVNEPLAYAFGGYLMGSMPPGRSRLEDFLDALSCTLQAKVDAARLLRGEGQPVATIMNLSPLYARAGKDAGAAGLTPSAAEESARSFRDLYDHVMWRSWISMLRDGVLDLPGRPPVEVPAATSVFDLVGFSYYHAATVDHAGVMGPYPPDGRQGPLGYVPWAEGLRECLERLAEEFPGRRLLISEFGVGIPPEDPGADEWRCQIMEEAVLHVRDALAGGIDVAGLFWWTGIDNYEWLHGYDACFGLFDRDRRPRPSAHLAAGYAGASID